MEFLSGTKFTLSTELENELAIYRHKVFIERLGWQLETDNIHERDQFDKDDTIYIVAREEEQIVGCARLLPTTEPYLMSEVFPQLLNGISTPHSPLMWEMSRFSALDLKENPLEKKRGTLSSTITAGLLDEAANFLKQFNVHTIVTVSPVGVERIIRCLGYDVHRAGPPIIVDGYPVIACVVDINSKTAI